MRRDSLAKKLLLSLLLLAIILTLNGCGNNKKYETKVYIEFVDNSKHEEVREELKDIEAAVKIDGKKVNIKYGEKKVIVMNLTEGIHELVIGDRTLFTSFYVLEGHDNEFSYQLFRYSPFDHELVDTTDTHKGKIDESEYERVKK